MGHNGDTDEDAGAERTTTFMALKLQSSTASFNTATPAMGHIPAVAGDTLVPFGLFGHFFFFQIEPRTQCVAKKPKRKNVSSHGFCSPTTTAALNFMAQVQETGKEK